jgi:hypothetical protein
MGASVIVGAYYNCVDGDIVRIIRQRHTTVSYRYAESSVLHECDVSVVSQWELRRDLHEFPDVLDLRLPIDFDLLWDIKYVSELRRTLSGHAEEIEIRRLMHDLGVSI